MTLADRRAKDKAVREEFPEALSAAAVADFIEDIHRRFYSNRTRLYDVYLYVWNEHHRIIRQAYPLNDHIVAELRRREKQRSLDLKIEPEYHI